MAQPVVLRVSGLGGVPQRALAPASAQVVRDRQVVCETRTHGERERERGEGRDVRDRAGAARRESSTPTEVQIVRGIFTVQGARSDEAV